MSGEVAQECYRRKGIERTAQLIAKPEKRERGFEYVYRAGPRSGTRRQIWRTKGHLVFNRGPAQQCSNLSWALGRIRLIRSAHLILQHLDASLRRATIATTRTPPSNKCLDRDVFGRLHEHDTVQGMN